MKRQATDWEKVFAKHIADEGLVSRMYTELLTLDSKKTASCKRAKDVDKCSTNEDTEIADTCIKRCSSYIIRGGNCRVKPRDTTGHLSEGVTSQTAGGTQCRAALTLGAGGHAEWYSHFRGRLAFS